MMKYRKISPCIWNDAKVRELSDKGKLALLFLLTHPHMTPLGAIRANAPGLDVFPRAQGRIASRSRQAAGLDFPARGENRIP